MEFNPSMKIRRVIALGLLVAGLLVAGPLFAGPAQDGCLSWGSRDPLKVGATDFFRLWPAMDFYVRFKHLLDEKSKAAFILRNT